MIAMPWAHASHAGTAADGAREPVLRPPAAIGPRQQPAVVRRLHHPGGRLFPAGRVPGRGASDVRSHPGRRL